jgi:hypothetical protein
VHPIRENPGVIERHDDSVYLLATFMTFSQHDHNVPRTRAFHGGSNGVGSIADLTHVSPTVCPREHLTPDFRGILRARVVIGHENDVSTAARRLPHECPLRPVPIASRTHDADHAPVCT